MPDVIKSAEALDLPGARTEAEVLAELRALADRNQVLAPMIGLGYYGTFTPPVILRNVMENPAWYTAYTPYQPEISQGRLEALLNFQTDGRRPDRPADLRRLPARRGHRRRRGHDAGAPRRQGQERRLPRRRRRAAADHRRDRDPRRADRRRGRRRRPVSDGIPAEIAERGVFGVLLQYPGASGAVRDLKPVIEQAHELGALVTVAADLLALTLLTSPGELGADIAVGTTQRFGVPMGFGGPHAGYMAVREKFARSLPGRLVGVSVDADGNQAYRLALQTREQHIRREKATSNICTAQVLLAVMAGMYAVYHGPEGLRRSPGAPTATPRSSPRGCGPAASRSCTTRTSTPSPSGCRAGPPRSSPPPASAGSTCAWSTPTTSSHRLRRDHRRARTSPPSGPRSVSSGDVEALDAARRRRAARRRCCAPTTTSRTRSSTSTAPRPRCCATCAGSPTATTRWTAA